MMVNNLSILKVISVAFKSQPKDLIDIRVIRTYSKLYNCLIIKVNQHKMNKNPNKRIVEL